MDQELTFKRGRKLRYLLKVSLERQEVLMSVLLRLASENKNFVRARWTRAILCRRLSFSSRSLLGSIGKSNIYEKDSSARKTHEERMSKIRKNSRTLFPFPLSFSCSFFLFFLPLCFQTFNAPPPPFSLVSYHWQFRREETLARRSSTTRIIHGKHLEISLSENWSLIVIIPLENVKIT